MQVQTIHQEITLPGTPLQIYTIWMDADHHAAFTGSEVEMEATVGAPFSVFDGYCTGKNLELLPGQRIKQEWRFEEEGWPQQHYSICTLELEPAPTGTQVHFTQEGVPAHLTEQLRTGWYEFYWEPLKYYLEDLV